MTTYHRICIKSYAVTDADGAVASVERGREYLSSAIDAAGTVTVFTRYWFPVPIGYFAGEEPFT